MQRDRVVALARLKSSVLTLASHALSAPREFFETSSLAPRATPGLPKTGSGFMLRDIATRKTRGRRSVDGCKTLGRDGEEREEGTKVPAEMGGEAAKTQWHSVKSIIEAFGREK